MSRGEQRSWTMYIDVSVSTMTSLSARHGCSLDNKRKRSERSDKPAATMVLTRQDLHVSYAVEVVKSKPIQNLGGLLIPSYNTADTITNNTRIVCYSGCHQFIDSSDRSHSGRTHDVTLVNS